MRASSFRRHRVVLSLAAGSVALVLGFSVFSAFLWRQAVRDREQADLERQRAEQATEFLKDLFRAAGPNATGGEDLTARELLERGKRRLASAQDDDPELRIELAGALGEIYRTLGAFDDSKQLMEESLRLARRHYGQDHPELAKRIANLGVLLYDHGDHEDAEGLFREALAMYRRLGLDEDYSFRVKDNLATVLMIQGDFEESGKLYRSVFEERRRRFGDHDVDVSASLRNLAALDYARGALEEAEAALRSALEIRRNAYGEADTRVASVLDLLGRVLTGLGRTREAEVVLEKALVIRRQLLGDNDYRVAQTKKNLAVLFAAEDPVRAVQVAREALDNLRRTKPDGWELAEAESILGACLTESGDYAEAQAYLVRGHVKLSSIRGDNAIYSRQALDRVLRLYDRWGKPEELEKYQEQR